MSSPSGPGAAKDQAESRYGRFRLSPPRHFVYPAILLLLTEKPRHGYTLMDHLVGLGFGPVDRPTVYRALAELEGDGLLRSWSAEARAGSTRHVYAPTDAGRRALEEWMAIVGGERDRLDMVLERYAALVCGSFPERALSGTAPPESASPRLVPMSAGPATGNSRPPGAPGPASSQVFNVVSERSAVLIRARSNVGPVEFGSRRITGSVQAVSQEGRVAAAPTGKDGFSGEVQVPVESLTSGNALYDAELLRRIDARSHPYAMVALEEVEALGSEDRFGVRARMTFHGVTVPLRGVVGVALPAGDRLIVRGEQVIDIRDFGVRVPSGLTLKIYPDVRVYLHLEAEA